MSCNGTPIREVLENFRDSKTFKDAVWQRNAFFSSRRRMEELINIKDDNNFRSGLKDLFTQFLMYGRMGELNHDAIIYRNTMKSVKEKFIDLLSENLSAKEKLTSILQLKEVGLFFGTSLLSLMYDDEFIIYHEKVLEGINETECIYLPIERVLNEEDYFLFNDACKAIQQMYEFKTLGEVHEFFWHGYENDWLFE